MDYTKLIDARHEEEPEDLPETDDLKELAKSAIPKLVRKAIRLAHKSERLNDVVAVLKELSDRAYGKPAQAIEHTGKITHETLILNRNSPKIIEGEVLDVEGPTKAIRGPE